MAADDPSLLEIQPHVRRDRDVTEDHVAPIRAGGLRPCTTLLRERQKTAQPVSTRIPQLAYAFAEHLKGGGECCVPVREDLRRGLDRSSGHGGGGECEEVCHRRSWRS